MTHLIRCLLTGLLIYMVYQETGTWTALVIFLISVKIELLGYAHRQRQLKNSARYMAAFSFINELRALRPKDHP